MLLIKKNIFFLLFALFIAVVLFFSLGSLYLEYKEFVATKKEIEVKVINNYTKHNKKGTRYSVLVCKYKSATFYTTIWGDIIDLKLRSISLVPIVKNLTFLEYLKGFFV